MNGTLYKYTNFARGWQRRFFIVENGSLEYFLRDPEGDCSNRRGVLPLVDAVVTPDEDGHGFTITASNGFIFKLKAADARSRQILIDQLRCAAKGVQKALPPEYISQVANSQADNYATKNVEHLHAAKESLAAARKYLAEIEDECDKLPMNETYLKLR